MGLLKNLFDYETKELKKMYNEGRLGDLINDVLLQDINEKVDTYKTGVDTYKTEVDTYKTEVDTFKTEVSEQLDTIEKEKATKQEVDVERKRIDLLTKIEGFTGFQQLEEVYKEIRSNGLLGL